MSELCSACLSGNRQLIPHENVEKYTSFWSIQYLKSSDKLCWECIAIMKKCWRFYQKVIYAHNLLQIEADMQEKKNITSLSTLTTYLTAIINYKNEAMVHEELIHSDTSVKIKMELNVDNEADDKLKSESDDDGLSNTDLNLDQELRNDELNLNILREQKKKTVRRKKPRLKREGGKIVFIETSLFENGVKQKLPVALTEREEKFDVIVVTEEEMLRSRETEKRSDKFRSSEFKCESCILKYKSEESYKHHLSKRHVQNPKYYTCAICLVTCTNITTYTAHFSRHYISYTCKLCLYQNASIRRMLDHHKNEHGQGGLHQCDSCSMEFSSGRRLRYHKSREHMELPPCEHCGKRFVTKAGLKAHMVNHAGITLYKCNICQKDYRGKFGLKAHMRTHATDSSNENAFCAECNKQFKNIYIYNQHLRLNSKHRMPNVLKYKCSYCDKQFHQKTGLTIHEDSIHFKKRAFVCHICNKDFIRNDRLKKHILHDHEGVPKPRDHICPYCGKGFTTQSILSNHIRTHTGERPYECEYCQTCFRQPTALKTHIKGVHQK